MATRETSRRRRGGVPERLSSMQRALADPDPEHWGLKVTALSDLTDLIATITRRAFAGDEDAGRFLAELLVFLEKKRPWLERANEPFLRACARLESARTRTTKGSDVRELVQNILAEANLKRVNIQVAPQCARVFRWDKRLGHLPDFNEKPEVVDQWMSLVVEPALRELEPQLRADPKFTSLKQACDSDGNLQLSRFIRMARKAAIRIGKLPPTSFFNIS